MKKIFFILGVVTMCLVAGCSCKNDEERFYDRKEGLAPAANEELKNLLLQAYGKAVEESGVKVKDHFILAQIHNSALDNARVSYHCLTEQNKYQIYSINTPEERTICYALHDGSQIELEYEIERLCKLIPDNVYYLIKGEILLRE